MEREVPHQSELDGEAGEAQGSREPRPYLLCFPAPCHPGPQPRRGEPAATSLLSPGR